MWGVGMILSADRQTLGAAVVRKAAILIGGAAVAMLGVSSAAQAQCAITGLPVQIQGLNMAGSLPASISTSVTTADTVFLTQTTAFVASPQATQPGQFAGGIWIRGVGGSVEVDSSAAGNFAAATVVGPINGTFSCTSRTKSTYGGFQAGADIGRLDIGGWNVHVGVTGGYLSMSNKTGTAKVDFDVPFVGMYAAATNGGFYIDAQVRYDFYDMSLTDSTLALTGRGLNAQGWGITASTGYIFTVGSVIIEPSVGVVYSSVSVDPLTFTAPVVIPTPLPTALAVTGTINMRDIETLLGRAGIRFATNTTVGNLAVQPFVAASVWHEFADDLTGNYRCVQPCGAPILTNLSATATGDRIGTFGQYSIGFAASLPNTPWLGYLRFDYRKGSQIEGINFNGGIRYQFAP
jgi:outer membrane autotransporter protein